MDAHTPPVETDPPADQLAGQLVLEFDCDPLASWLVHRIQQGDVVRLERDGSWWIGPDTAA